MLDGFSREQKHALRLVKMRRDMEMVGYCYGCGDWVLRRDVEQQDRDECCVYVCRHDGTVIDQHPPFA